jgi:hypothetical protein
LYYNWLNIIRKHLVELFHWNSYSTFQSICQHRSNR